MNTRKTKVFAVAAVMLVLALAGFGQDKTDPSSVRISWEEFKKLLELGQDKITLSWAEFQKIIVQTGTTVLPPFELQDEKVVLSREQFKRLLDRMKPPAGDPVQRPGDYLLRKAAYGGRLAGGALQVHAEVVVDVFPSAPGVYVRIPLFPASTALRDVSVDGRAALLVVDGGRYTLVTNQRGPQRIAADFALRAGGDQVQNLSFPVLRSPITTVEFDLPHDRLEVEIDAAQQLEVSDRGGKTHVFAVLPPADYVSMRWRKRIVEAAAGPAKVYADTMSLLSVEDDALRVTAEISLSILQNTIPAVVVRVPDGYSILDVRGNGVGDWREITRKDAAYLEIPFDFPKKGNFTITITAEKLLSGAAQAVGFSGFAVADAVREKGFLGVELKGAAEVVLAEAKGADALDVSELPASLVGRSMKPLLFGFKYLRPPFSVVFDIKKHEEVPVVGTVIDMASGVTLFTEDGKLVHRVVYSVRNTSKQFLQVALPAGAELWSVFVGGEAARPRLAGGKVLIPLNRSRQGASGLAAFDVEMIYHERASRFAAFGGRAASFPVPDVIISQVLWSVYLPVGYDYLHFGGTVDKEAGVRGFRPILGLRRRATSMVTPSPAAPGAEAAGDLRDKVQRQASELKKGFAGKLVLDESQMANQAENEIRFNQRLEAVQAGAATTAAGSLSLRVQIPTSGELYRFAKTLVSGEPVTLRISYMAGGFKLLAALVVLAAAAAALFVLLRRSRGGRGGGDRRRLGVRIAVVLFAAAVVLLALSQALALICLASALAVLVVFRTGKEFWIKALGRKKTPPPSGPNMD